MTALPAGRSNTTPSMVAVRAGAENGVAMLRVEALWRALDMINPA